MATKTKPRLERDIQRAVLHALRAYGVTCWRNNVGSFAGEYNGKRRYVKFGVPGMSDIIGYRVIPQCRHKMCEHTDHIAQFVAVEVKRPGGKIRAEQQAFLDAVARHGGVGMIAYSVEDIAIVFGGTKL